MTSILKNRSVTLYIILAGFFICNALLAEIIGVKIFSLESTFGLEMEPLTLFGQEGLQFNLTAGVLLWPVVFIMTDVINEYYGEQKVRFLSYLTSGLILYAFAMIYLAIYVAPNEWWQYESGLLGNTMPTIKDMDAAFHRIMGQGMWIIIGSLVAFLLGQIIDVAVFHRIKAFSGEGMIWLRATGSTLISQFIDSYVVLIIAFYWGANWDLSRVLAIGTMNYIYKFVMAVGLTPFIYLAHNLIDRYLGEDLAHQMKAEATKK